MLLPNFNHIRSQDLTSIIHAELHLVQKPEQALRGEEFLLDASSNKKPVNRHLPRLWVATHTADSLSVECSSLHERAAAQSVDAPNIWAIGMDQDHMPGALQVHPTRVRVAAKKQHSRLAVAPKPAQRLDARLEGHPRECEARGACSLHGAQRRLQNAMPLPEDNDSFVRLPPKQMMHELPPGGKASQPNPFEQLRSVGVGGSKLRVPQVAIWV